MTMRYLGLILLALRAGLAAGQETTPVDSLKTFVVSATLSPLAREDVPARVTTISGNEIQSTPVSNSDELLMSIPGVFVNRSWGIFSKNGAVTMRGLSGSARVLVLLDGIPLNRAGGGGINWHLIGPDQLSHIEVLSGPASSLYGQNAMGGVIQLFSKQPSTVFSLQGGIDHGSYNTTSGHLSAGRTLLGNRGYWFGQAFYRGGDGYMLAPEDQRTQYHTKAFLREGNLHLGGGIRLKPGHELKVTALAQRDMRGTGVKVFEPDGGYNSYNTQLFSLRYTGQFTKRTSLTTAVYFQREGLATLDEKVNNQGKYKLLDSETLMNDLGLLIHAVHKRKKHQVTAGGEFRFGQLASTDHYRTSTDQLEAGGIQHIAGLFIQDEVTLGSRLLLISGLRFDAATFRKGYLNVTNPSGETGFAMDLADRFDAHAWNSLSPKIALKYKVNPTQSYYVSAGRGFSAPKLNDLTSSGKIRKGFKLANPELGPEIITTIETGTNLKPIKKLEITPSVYYSYAQSLQYQVSTGDSMDVSGVLSPVLQVRNAAGVRILGAEFRFDYSVFNHLKLYGSYSYSVSLLNTEKSSDLLLQKLDGKYLSEVPTHLAAGGIQWNRERWYCKADWTFTGELWYDDENSIITDSYHLFNLKAGYLITPSVQIILTVQDLFDHVHIDKKGLLSPGRFIVGALRYRINGK
jgi:iron complex outermembrane recepter protein